MKTLTITDAKKNLSKWLQAAAKGEEVAIVSGADIIALRKVEVEASDYAWREYGLTQEEVADYEQRVDARYAQLKKTGGLMVLTADDVKSQITRAQASGNSDASPAAKAKAAKIMRHVVQPTRPAFRAGEERVANENMTKRISGGAKSRGGH
jgi:antitoxin (DNA-binding transcriptional repressor) of toxin-antitoxin stability system